MRFRRFFFILAIAGRKQHLLCRIRRRQQPLKRGFCNKISCTRKSFAAFNLATGKAFFQ